MAEGEKRGRIGGASPNPYFEDHKYPEPTVCPRCHLVYRHGRWQRSDPLATSEHPHLSQCPACRREIDRFPGGLVTLRGSYLVTHRDEILHIIRNQETAASALRPLQRILWIEEADGSMEVATTMGHLAIRIAHAVEGACKGSLTLKRAHDDQLVRAYWERDA